MLQEKTSYKPFLIAWNLTRQCNLRCRHCYIDAGEKGGLPELTREEGYRLIDDIASVNPDTILVLTGGEPILYRHTLDFARYASKKGLMVVVGTNGILLDDRMVKRLIDSGVSGVGISLDSIDPSIHDTFRGVPGAWNHAVEAIRQCRSHGLQFQIHNSVMSFNWGEVPQVVKFAYKEGARVVNFFFMVCTGRGEKLTDITPQQYEEVLSTLIDLQAKYPDILIRARCAPHFKRIAYQKDPHSPITKAEGYLGGGCLAGAHYCRIAPDGEVTPCPYMPLSVGNVRRNRFSDIWENAPPFKDLRSLQLKGQLKGKCGECEFKILCGGCRARPYASHGDFLDEDLWCQYTPQGGEKIGVAQMKGDIKVIWTKEGEKRLKRLPFFLRSMIKGKVEKYAEENKILAITPELLDELRRRRFGDKFPDMEKGVEWTAEALDRLQKAPEFLRNGIKKAAESMARRRGVSLITSELLTQFRNEAMMKAVKRIKSHGFTELTFDAFDYAKDKFKNIKGNKEAQEILNEIKEYVASKGKIGLIDEEMLKKMKEYLSNE